MAGFGQTPQFPFMYPGAYSPGQVGFNNNAELSQLISMFSGPLLNKLAGPGSFVPSMMPTQQITDQFAMRNYQDQTRAAAFGIAHDNTPNLANRFLGLRSAFTQTAPSELNREQASNMAGIANDPITKMALGMAVGPENLEALYHGSKGDVGALQSQISRIGYFRPDPSGTGRRMDSESLMNYSRGLYAHMYEPQGNLEEIERDARSKDSAIQDAGRKRLKQAAQREDLNIVEDDEIVSRLESMKDAPERVDSLYKKYVHGGKETDTKKQAQELVKFDRAIQASGQLEENETSIRGLVKRAERVPVNEMHGFMAGQVGQITENMFQRGMLPQSVGSMSAADRARMINQTPLDAETEKRLAKEMGKRDLENTSNSSAEARQYRGLNTEKERDAFLDRNVGDYEKKLKKTREEVEKTATGDPNAMAAGDLEKLQGFDSLASNVDAKRSSEAIKKYTGAVAAIRDIFGDNGNPNAPLPALLAALEGLTGGAVGSMKPQKIESTLRQMQTAAKEAGIGFEQMAAMSTQIDSMGQALNLTPADTMRIKAGSMAAVKVMQDTGAFSSPVYGQVDKGTATGRVSELITRGAASRASRSMASLEAVYQADIDPKTGKSKRFAGTELEEALKAYRNNEGDGTYTYNGEKKNIREIIGRGGAEAAEGLLTGSGGKRSEFVAQLNNPNAMQYSNEMFGFLAQKHEQIRDINYGDTQFRVHDRLQNKTKMFDGLDSSGRGDLSAKVGDVMARMVVETSGMKTTDQITKIQNDLESELTKEFEKTMPPAQAAAKAKEAASALSSREDINEVIAGANSVYAANTGGRQLSENYQYRGNGRDLKTAQEHSRQEKRAERRSAVNMGHEGSMMGRFSDYLLDIGVNQESFNLDEMLKAVGGTTTDHEILRQAATPELRAGFDALGSLRRDAFVTNKDVDKLTERVKGGGENGQRAMHEMRKIADLAETDKDGKYTKQIITDRKEVDKLREEQIAKDTSDSNKLLLQYREYGLSTSATAEELDKPENAARKKSMLDELRKNDSFMADMTRKGLGENRYSYDELVTMNRKQVGTAKDGQQQLAEDTDKIQNAFLYGNNEDVRKAGVFAAFRAIDQHTNGKMQLSSAQQDAIMAAVSDTSEGGKQKLTEALKGITDPGALKMAQQIFGGIQSGTPIALGEMLGMDKIRDKELESQIGSQLEARGIDPKAAKDIKTNLDKQKEEAKKAGEPKTAEEAKAAELKRVETALKDTYVANGMNEPEAAKKAKEDAAGILSKTETATKETGGATQRVDKLEITAQTVVVKGGKVEGGASTGSTADPGDPTAATEPGTEQNPLQKAGDALSGAAGFISNLLPTDMLDNIKQMGTAALNGILPRAATADEPKPDAPVAPEPAADAPPAPDPDAVQQANDAQLKHDTGNTTNEPAPAPAPKTTAPETAAPKTPVSESAPISMTSLMDAAKSSLAGQAVLQGATALYEEFAPEAVKDMAENARVDATPANDEQMRHQEMYLHHKKKMGEATTDMEREAAQRGMDDSVATLGEHNAARAAGIDTTKGMITDRHAQTINGQPVKSSEIDRHTRLLKERIAKDPDSILSPAIKEKHGLAKTPQENVKEKNDAEYKKNAGASSANVSPAAAAAAITQKPPAAETSKTSQPAGEQTNAATQNALSQEISESTPAASGVSAANRVQSMPASAAFGQTSAPSSGGGAGHAGGAGGGQSNGMTINGTLTLSGLQEAILSAQGAQVMQTEGGAPVVIDPPTAPRAAAAPRQ